MLLLLKRQKACSILKYLKIYLCVSGQACDGAVQPLGKPSLLRWMLYSYRKNQIPIVAQGFCLHNGRSKDDFI